MGWWQERKARKNVERMLGKEYTDQMITELKAGRKQAEMIRDELRKKESKRYIKLIDTINQIAEGSAPAAQKKQISIRLVEGAGLSDWERQDLLDQLNNIYD